MRPRACRVPIFAASAALLVSGLAGCVVTASVGLPTATPAPIRPPAETTSPAVGGWRSDLYPEAVNARPPAAFKFESDRFLQDFSYAGYAAGERPLPTIKEPRHTVTDAAFGADPTGRKDSTQAIQAAIDRAGETGGVVFLPAGTYLLAVPEGRKEALLIAKPRVVLRGAGADRTFLINRTVRMRSKTVVRVAPPAGGGAFFAAGTHQISLTADLLNPTVRIPVADVTPFATGDYVVLRHEISDAWVNEQGEPSWRGAGKTLRSPVYFRRLVAVDRAAMTLVVDVPIRHYLKVRDLARVHKLAASPLLEVGIEDLAIANREHPGEGWGDDEFNREGSGAYDVHGAYLISFERTRDCWARRVTSYRPADNKSGASLLSNGILLNQSSRVTLADCRLSHPQYGGEGGNGYLYRLQHANDCLVIRCQADYARHGFVMSHAGTNGTVLHACRDSRTGHAITAKQGANGGGSDHHMHFSHANLIDTCTADDSWWEARYRPHGSAPLHGVTSAHTVFWNNEGLGRLDKALIVSEQGRYGYVIGTRGGRASVERPARSAAATDPVDVVEGVGRGASLEPFSLYREQLLRRTGNSPQP